ncbi:MAG TPA: Na/Pi symporter [Thermoanaerobaculia bacterium]|nr:Na/Pi symporter [Thermoanaerobaculia bacterium]
MTSLILGGIGLFLLGMVLMTEGLKSAAGELLRTVLSRFTGGPVKAVVSGAAITAIVQSSSATTLATIGFVSAGLLTFPQAVGVVLGANVGTTSTGWIVALVGLKVNVSAVALPLIGIGALMRLLGSNRVRSFGMALAGFGLIFVGIDTLQSGMSDLAQRVDPASLPGGSFLGRTLLVITGALMTFLMQSSSAAMATTLAALDSGTISLEQGGALVIGQNVGTTLTAAIAAVGASVPAKRTAVAHILFNVLTGALALAILPLMLALVDRVDGQDGGPGTLAAFHTAFNLLGVVLILPFVGRFARAVMRIVPEREQVLTRHLDATVTNVPAVAIEAARRTVAEIALTLFTAQRALLSHASGDEETFATADAALGEVRRFLAAVRTSPEAALEHRRHISTLHAIDHLDRILEELKLPGAGALMNFPEESRRIEKGLDLALDWLSGTSTEVPLGSWQSIAEELAHTRLARRKEILEKTAIGLIDPEEAERQLDGLRWFDRIGYHTYRAIHHLAAASGAEETETSEVYAESGSA